MIFAYDANPRFSDASDIQAPGVTDLPMWTDDTRIASNSRVNS